MDHLTFATTTAAAVVYVSVSHYSYSSIVVVIYSKGMDECCMFSVIALVADTKDENTEKGQ
jgi:hypothetical protein